MKHKIALLLLIWLPFSSEAQLREWSLEELIAACLENNFDIRIAENQQDAATNLANRGQAGYLPSLGLNAGSTYSNNRTRLEFAGGIPDVEQDGVENTGLSASLGLNYVLFNGLGRLADYSALMARKDLSEVEARVVAENAVYELIQHYLNMQQMQLDLQALYQNRNITSDRLKRIQKGFENGSRSGADLIATRIDFNSDSLAVIQQINLIEKEKAAINLLLGREAEAPFFVKKEWPIPAAPDFSKVKENAMRKGSAILLAYVSKDLAEHQTQALVSTRYPVIALTAGYGLNASQNGAGIVLTQNTLGFNAGLNFSMPLYNGNQLNNAIKNARLEEDNSELRLKQASQQLNYQIRLAELDQYEIKTRISTLEVNIVMAEDLVKRAEIGFANGQLTYNELRTFQLQLLQSMNALHQANVQLALLYYGLLRLEGSLLGGI